MKKRVLVTCGPAIAPIDDVRFLSNVSSGELGHLLAAGLAGAGFEVDCFCGRAAAAGAGGGYRTVPFTTNQDLLDQLKALPGRDAVAALFHAAALTDFEADRIESPDGASLAEFKKIPSRSQWLTLHLKPAVKVLPQLPTLFPGARVVGWKYELEGGRDAALAAAKRQIAECRTPACVVNGAAYGPGFGFLDREGALREFPDKPALVRFLAGWLGA
jgi:phosphopantothenoylcysteine synthetase/decarboxylase